MRSILLGSLYMYNYIFLSLGCHLIIMERIRIISVSQVLLANFISFLLAFFLSYVLQKASPKKLSF